MNEALQKHERDHLNDIDEKRNKEQIAYLAMNELQKLIDDAKKYEEKIEEMHGELAHLSIKIKMQEQANEFLLNQKEDIDE